MISPTYGKVSNEEMLNIILQYYNKNKHFDTPFHIVVGTDSQNYEKTKVVRVLVVQCEGHGGIYFYEIEKIEKIRDVRTKLNYETQKSLSLADNIIEIIENDEKYQDLYLNCSFSIHVDAGNSEHGKTKELIPSLVGWIKSCGYQCQVKPDSFAASSVADKISK